MAGRRVLFFPWPIGAGHTGRSLVAASILRAQGDECCFASDPTTSWVSNAGFTLLASTGARRAVKVRPPASRYLAIPSLDAAFGSIGYYHPSRVAAQVECDLAAIQAARPDIVVTHMQPTAAVAARIANVPLVSIADGDFLARGDSSWMPWIEAGAARLSPYPSCVPAFNAVRSAHGLRAVDDASELLYGDLVLIASTPKLDPIPPGSSVGAFAHVGPLLWDVPGVTITNRLKSLAQGRARRIYMTLGSGEVSSSELVEAAGVLAREAAAAVAVAAGYGVPEGPTDPGVLVTPLGGMSEAMQWADVVICHGGHSTVLSALTHGKPIVVVPEMSENEANGRSMVEAHGAGILTKKTSLDCGRRLTIHDRYPDVIARCGMGGALVRAVDEIMSNGAYAAAANRLAAELQPWLANRDRLVAAWFDRLGGRGPAAAAGELLA